MRELAITELTEAEFLEAYETEGPEVSRFLPDSQSGWELVRTWEADEPPPLRWVVQDLIPEGFPASLYGDGGTGKSLLAQTIAMHTAIGIPFLGHEVLRGRVLYVDAEMDEAEFLRRAYRIARGLGLSRPPEGLYYLNLRSSLADPDAMRTCAAKIREVSPVLTILDSFGATAHGADTNSAADVTTILRGLATWGTTLMIDHIPKPAPGANQSQIRAHGSAYKFNLVRSAISAVKVEGGAITLRPMKSNFGPIGAPINVAFVFGTDAVRLERVAIDDERLAGAENHLSALDRVSYELHDRGVRGATAEEMGETLGMKPKTVQNYLSKLIGLGRAEKLGGGRWRVPIPETFGDGNGKE